MMVLGKQRVRQHMTLEYDFSGIRILNSMLVPVDWHLSVDLVAVDRPLKEGMDAEYNATIAYNKMFFWMDTNLPGIIILDVSCPTDLYIANMSSNTMMYSPSEPYDDILATMLHKKMSVLANDDLVIGEIRLRGSDMSVKYTFGCSPGEHDLPETTDYYPGGKTRDTIPWWARNDGFCFEFVKPDDETIPDEEFYKDIVDPLVGFDASIREAADEILIGVREPARIVQIDKWKPKKI